MKILCPKCGKKLNENSTVCNYCGNNIIANKDNFIKQYVKNNYPYNVDIIAKVVIFAFFACFLIAIILACTGSNRSFNNLVGSAIPPLVLEIISEICFLVFRIQTNNKLRIEANKKYDEMMGK